MNDDHHQGALLEDMNDKLQRLAEGMSVLIEGNQEIRRIVADVPVIADDIKAIKAAVTDQTQELHQHERQLGDHERRLRNLERTA